MTYGLRPSSTYDRRDNKDAARDAQTSGRLTRKGMPSVHDRSYECACAHVASTGPQFEASV
jgi:hypothetical protein